MIILKKYRLAIFCALLSFSVHSQNQQLADSILNVIENQKLDQKALLESYFWLSSYSTVPNDELKYGYILLNLATELKNDEYIIKAYHRIGVANRLKGNLTEAFRNLFEGIKIALTYQEPEFQIILANLYTELATCYTLNNDSENAILYGIRNIEVLRRTNHQQQLALNLLNLGYDYYLIGDNQNALESYLEAEEILEDLDFELGIAYLIGNKALVYWKQRNIEQAKLDLVKAVNMLYKAEDYFAISDFYNQLSNIYLEENLLSEAESYANKALTMAKENGLKEQVRDAYNLLFMIAKKRNDYEEGVNFQTLYHAYKDSIHNQETADLLANLNAEVEINKKQAEVDLLLSQKKTNQLIITIGGIFICVVLALTIFIFIIYRSKLLINKQLEEQTTSLIALNDTKDKFFSIISHDLRGPVNVINGLIFIVKKDLAKMDSGEMKVIFEHMEHSARQLVELLDTHLHWALQQRGQIPYKPVVMNLRDEIEAACEIFKEMCASKEISLDISGITNCHILADKNATSTIFRNLLNNAIKFTEVSGSIKIYAEEDQSSGYAIIHVEDNGIGITQDKITTLFDKKTSASVGTLGETGIGLGLQLVQEFVQLNKGKITVQSEEGNGTVFSIYLPLATSQL